MLFFESCKVGFGAVQKRVNLVDEKCCKMSIPSQESALLQPKTGLPNAG